MAEGSVLQDVVQAMYDSMASHQAEVMQTLNKLTTALTRTNDRMEELELICARTAVQVTKPVNEKKEHAQGDNAAVGTTNVNCVHIHNSDINGGISLHFAVRDINCGHVPSSVDVQPNSSVSSQPTGGNLRVNMQSRDGIVLQNRAKDQPAQVDVARIRETAQNEVFQYALDYIDMGLGEEKEACKEMMQHVMAYFQQQHRNQGQENQHRNVHLLDEEEEDDGGNDDDGDNHEEERDDYGDTMLVPPAPKRRRIDHEEEDDSDDDDDDDDDSDDGDED
jgi:hypothetical protein